MSRKPSSDWHRITNVKEDYGDCSQCGRDVRVYIRETGYYRCAKMLDEIRYRTTHQKRSHGLTLKEANDYVAFMGCCQMCEAETKLCVDHNHATGQVRGVLCYRCNRAIVILEDPELLRQGQEYLQFWKESGASNTGI